MAERGCVRLIVVKHGTLLSFRENFISTTSRFQPGTAVPAFTSLLRRCRQLFTDKNKRLRRGLVSFSPLAALCLLTACAVQPPSDGAKDGDWQLTVLHTNDVHANWGGLNARSRICYQAQCDVDAGGLGGVVRMDRAVRAIRASLAQPNQAPSPLLLLDAGDQFQGTLFYKEYKDTIVAEVLNALNYDAVTPGNHEFDNGCEAFSSLLEKVSVPVLAANLSFSDRRAIAKKIAPWRIVEKEGRRIGLIGLVNPHTPNLSSPCQQAQFADVVPALRQAVSELQQQKINVIVLITHLGLNDDLELARQVSGVDIIVGGHTHTLLSNKQKGAEGAYPIVPTSPSNEPVVVVTDGFALKTLGHIQVTFNAAGVAQKWQGEPIVLNDEELRALNAPPADEALVDKINKRGQPIQALFQKGIGTIDSPIAAGLPLDENSMTKCRRGECLTANIIADAMREYWKGKADITLLNAGSIRNSLPSGKVTVGDIDAAFPFQDLIVLSPMNGATLLQALEHGLSRYQETRGHFLQVSGLRYHFNGKNAVGKRLVSAEVWNKKDKRWNAVKPKQIYRVVLSDYLANGGDDFHMFKNLPHEYSKELNGEILNNFFLNRQKQGRKVPAQLGPRIIPVAQ